MCVVVFLMWQQWRIDYGPAPTEAPSVTREGGGEVPATAPTALSEDTGVPEIPSDAIEDHVAPATTAPSVAEREVVNVRTDVVNAEIDLAGGNLHRLELLHYPVSVDRPDLPFRLLGDIEPDVFVAQSGLLSAADAPNHRARFRATRREYALGAADELEVRLDWESDGPIGVTKVYTFRRDSYLIDVRYEVRNNADTPWAGRLYGQFLRAEVPPEGGLFRTYTYTGGVISGPEKPYEKIEFSDMEKNLLERETSGGWVAMIQHYFAGAWVPDQSATNRFYSLEPDGVRYVLGLMTPGVRVQPGDSSVLSIGLYVGPKVQARMEAAAPNLKRAVDYGWLWLIAQPLFWLLDWIHGIVGNWGWSIIILTLLVKLAFFHLSAASYKSMARMRKVQPRITAIRDRYGGDKSQMNQKMMELYREEKINPLGGCLPIVVQIPVFIALYWVLLESVELRQASFIGWLDDLSLHDPYFVLPVLMGVTMLIQQKLNPTPPDPMQAKIMMALPFVFTFFFLFFPSGLVLYWFVNNVLSIIQQWVITKKIVGET
jgi:YidC/Oxa1 family membrane protein insertase